jgi:hypothetical protein
LGRDAVQKDGLALHQDRQHQDAAKMAGLVRIAEDASVGRVVDRWDAHRRRARMCRAKVRGCQLAWVATVDQRVEARLRVGQGRVRLGAPAPGLRVEQAARDELKFLTPE